MNVNGEGPVSEPSEVRLLLGSQYCGGFGQGLGFMSHDLGI